VANRILVVEDEPQVLGSIERILKREGYETMGVQHGKAVVKAVQEFGPDLILLDILLPDLDGRHVMRDLQDRPDLRHIPVIFLTGLESEADRVMGLDLGAEDYITKPFGAFELAARVRACLRRRRSGDISGPPLKRGKLVLDGQNRTSQLGTETLKLQPKEFDILYLLASNAGRLLTRSFLIQSTSSYGAEVSTRSLDTHIKNIRKKLGAYAKFIETVPKMGYRFDPPSK
jgi:DNA-binding response OmpR family regulator